MPDTRLGDDIDIFAGAYINYSRSNCAHQRQGNQTIPHVCLPIKATSLHGRDLHS